MQFFRDMSEPASTDITQYPGYSKLSGDEQKKVAETYTNVYNNNQGKLGYRIAQGIAFATAKKMCESYVEEAASPAAAARAKAWRATERARSTQTPADHLKAQKAHAEAAKLHDGAKAKEHRGQASVHGSIAAYRKSWADQHITPDEEDALHKSQLERTKWRPNPTTKAKKPKKFMDEGDAEDFQANNDALVGMTEDDAGFVSGANPEEDGAARILRMNHDKMCVGCGAIHPLDVMCFNGSTHSEAGAGGGNGSADIMKQNHAQKGMRVEDSDPDIAAAARYLTNRAKVSGLMESLEEGAGDIQKKNVDQKCPDCGAMHGPKEKCDGQSEPDTDKETEREVDDADKILKKNHKDKGLDERKIFGIGPSKGKPSPKVGAALKKYVAGQAKPPVVKEDEIDEKHIGFKALQGKLERNGKSAESAGAIAASIGKKKYGASAMKKGAASHTPLGEDVELNEEIEQMWAESFYPAKPLEESCGNCSHPKSYHTKACQTCNECTAFNPAVDESEHKKNQICFCGHQYGNHGNGGCKDCKHEGVVSPSKAAHQFLKNNYKERFEDEYNTIFAAQQGKIHTTFANATLNWLPEEESLEEGKGYEDIGPGDHVKFNHPLRGSDKTPQQGKGKVVMKGPAGWVLNTGGKYGTPAIVSSDNYVSHRKAKKKMTEDEMIDSMVEDAYDDHRAAYNVDDEANKKKEAARKKKNQARRDRDSVMRDMGLNKVKGSQSGKTYWESEEVTEADETHGGSHKAGEYKPNSCPSCATTDKRSEKDKTDLKGLVKEKESDPYAKFRDPKIDYYSERHPNSTMLTDRAQRANYDMINRLAGHFAKERSNPKAKTEEVDPLMAAALEYINHEAEELSESNYKPLDRLHHNTISQQITPGLSLHSGQAKGQGTAGKKYPLTKDDVRVMTKSALDDPYEKMNRKRTSKQIFGESEDASDASDASEKAEKASELAYKTNKSRHHNDAFHLHRNAAFLHMNAGNREKEIHHRQEAQAHILSAPKNYETEETQVDPLMAAALGYINHEVERAGGPTDLEEWKKGRSQFADPGGNSALRAASKSNPRNLPCPTCKQPNKLTPKDVAKKYQCDDCANMEERGW